MSALAVALLLVGDPPPEPPPPVESPRLLGRLLGAGNGATVRVGAWFGNLTRGPNQLAYDSSLEAALGVEAPGRDVGRGSGIMSDFGLSLTIGDYDFAVSLITDELIGGVDVGDPVASAVLRKILGEVRSRALRELIGVEVWAGVRSGGFEGPLDGSRFQIRNGATYFGPREDLWSSSYLAIELGVEQPLFDLFDAFYVRYLQFGIAHALEFLDEDVEGPAVLQDVDVKAAGFGLVLKPVWTFGDGDLRLFLASIPLTGVAAISYGPWGTIYGFLVTADARVEVGWRFDLGGVLSLRPFLAFEAELVMPFTGSFDLEAEGAPSVALPDYFFFGPLAGLEVGL